MGYLHNPEKTAEVMNPDGFYQTGDLGSMDSEGSIMLRAYKINFIIHRLVQY